MNCQYLCPHCNSHLRVRENIILAFKSMESEKRGIILLNPKLGNYGFIVHNTIEFEHNEEVDFICPACFTDLRAREINDKLIKIMRIDLDGNVYEVFFSRFVGEHVTFKIEKNNIIEKFGEDASSYLSYFSTKLKQQLQEN